MDFYLGVYRTHWLGTAGVPLFVSTRSLASRKKLPRAIAPWAVDCGGFTELQMYGRWETAARDYCSEVRRYRDEIGMLQWAPIQDWMCEPVVISGGVVNGVTFKGTLKSVKEHQERTVASWHELTSLAPDLPWIPVLQGWTPDDYLRCVELYSSSGVDLTEQPLVGVGSVCRRQGTEEALEVLRPLHALELRLHGFGFKTDGLWAGGAFLLAGADSMAWSKAARYDDPLPGCEHRRCNNCLRYAMKWRDNVLKSIERGAREYQPTLFV